MKLDYNNKLGKKCIFYDELKFQFQLFVKKQKQTKSNFFKLASIKNRYAVMFQKLKSL